jgi:histidyl-tRNA synthetase
VIAALDALGIAYRQNDRLVRGLDYYTRTAFEYWDPGLDGQQNALGGGGRYDGLAGVLGFSETPGVGFAMGEDRVVLGLRERGRLAASMLPQVAVIPGVAGAETIAMGLAGSLRKGGLRVVVQYGRRSLKAHMRQAQKTGAPVVLILGDTEVAAGQVAVRDMARAEQSVVPQDQAVAAVRRLLETVGEPRA